MKPDKLSCISSIVIGLLNFDRLFLHYIVIYNVFKKHDTLMKTINYAKLKVA